MKDITIEKAGNGWIVKEILDSSFGRGSMVPTTSSVLVFRTVEELAKDLPNILTETKVTEPT